MGNPLSIGAWERGHLLESGLRNALSQAESQLSYANERNNELMRRFPVAALFVEIHDG